MIVHESLPVSLSAVISAVGVLAIVDLSAMIQVVVAGAAVVSAVAALVAATRSGAAVTKTTEVHQLVNSRMEELLKLTREASKAEGVLQERDAAAVEGPASAPSPTPGRQSSAPASSPVLETQRSSSPEETC